MYSAVILIIISFQINFSHVFFFLLIVPGNSLDLSEAALVLVADRTEEGAENPGQEAGPDLVIPENTGGQMWGLEGNILGLE